MNSTERNIDMTLRLDLNGNAVMTYRELESGEGFCYRFTFSSKLDDDRMTQAKTIGLEVLSWLDVMQEDLKTMEG